MKVAIVGLGKMGQTIEEVAQSRGHLVTARIERGDDLALARGADVALEFTRPDEAHFNVLRLLDLGVATVCGTTGWDAGEASRRSSETGTPLLVAPNFSIGMAVLRELVARAAELLKPFPEFEPGLFERHHARKVDAPSGTARMLAALLESTLGRGVPVGALRHGGQPGEHLVIFDGPDESLELVHRARSRRIFALGAVTAAEWIERRRPRGPVTFTQVLAGDGREPEGGSA